MVTSPTGPVPAPDRRNREPSSSHRETVDGQLPTTRPTPKLLADGIIALAERYTYTTAATPPQPRPHNRAHKSPDYCSAKPCT